MPRSGRCGACKIRKIKCDEGLPQCKPCIDSGKTCPGYQGGTESIFRDMTCTAEKKVESRVRNSVKARNLEEQSGTRPVAAEEWRESAVTRFFAEYVMGSDAVLNTTTFLPYLYGDPNAGACLSDAAHAAAFTNLANQLGLEWMAGEAKAAYGRAIASLAKVLQDPVEVLKDTTLATPFVIGLYEAISGSLPTGTLMDHHHHRGRMSLLRLRGSDQFKSPTGRCLFGVLQKHAIMKCLNRHEKPLEEAGAWTRLFGNEGPPQEMTHLSIHTAEICAEAQLLFDSSERNDEWKRNLLGIIREASAIELLYQSWIDKSSTSKIWRYHTVHLSSHAALPANATVQVHHDVYTAYIWASCRSKRAHLVEVSMQCLTLLGCHSANIDISSTPKSLSLDKSLLTRSQRIIENMISDVCATAPFMQGDIDSTGRLAWKAKRLLLAGYMLLWPLLVARASSQRGSEMEAWINSRFELISSEMGIRYGRIFAHKVRKESWDLS